jgi:hypothetical protein
VARAYPHLWRNSEAAKKALQRDQSGIFSYENTLIGKCPAVVFQREGERRHVEHAVYDPRRVPDPRAAIEAMVGPLAKFEVIELARAEGPDNSDTHTRETAPRVVGNLALAPDPEPEVIEAEPPPLGEVWSLARALACLMSRWPRSGSR